MRRLLAAGVIVVSGVIAWSATASATPTPPESSTEAAWLDGLTERVITDVAAGKPLVAEVHVPLCDNTIIPCGNPRLGDGDNPKTNLYWATTPGFGVWFGRSGGGWKRVAKIVETGDPDILETHVYRRSVRAPASWRKRRVAATFEVDVVVHAWRGSAIDRALAAYAAQISSDAPRTLKLADGSSLAIGGAAQLVAWVGHNRLMDLARFEWPTPSSAKKGTIAIACHTAAYMEEHVPAETRVPLLMTRDFLFANAAPLEAAVLAFAAGGSYARIRNDAAIAYAKVRDRPVAKIAGAFTNPADRRWKKR
ncbi:MAG: hypothetical protein H0T89_01425 [Deltaproteobacteria bacterium]|nr:hypothetical protein [Deltaproteobacteria bacterium]MDQ3296850.1 hypothetical protein [Myxococcota bacterium]